MDGLKLNHTVVEMKKICEEKGLKGYSKLCRADLIKLLNPTNIMDSEILTDPTPILTPTKYKEPKEEEEKTKYNWRETWNWIEEQLVEKPKKYISEKYVQFKSYIASLFNNGEKFEIVEMDRALKGFAKQYIIEGREGINPVNFFNQVEKLVIEHLKDNAETRNNFVLNCVMVKENIITGEIIERNIPFRSKRV